MLADYLTTAREYLAGGVSTLRDRRRKERRRLEEIFDRKTFVSLLVLGTASKVVERLLVPLVAREPVEWNIAATYVAFFALSTFIAVYWKRAAAAAGEVGDAVEDAVSSEET